MKVTVIGSGYVGLVSGACLAEVGNDVLCLDVNADKIRLLQSGGVPIYEPGLEDVIKRNVAAGRLKFTTNVAEAARFGVLQFIGVGTPPGEDGSADLQYVIEAARNIGRHMTEYRVIIDKSTVPVGTADKVRAAVAEELARRGADIPFSVCSNPEFLKEGAAIDDFMRPDRIVVGCDDNRALGYMKELYAPFNRNRDRLITMDVKSAELTKYAANAMLATRISFMNELANLADVLGADIESVRKGIGSDTRIGFSFLYAGCGYGGSCFPKDVKALIRTAKVEAAIDLRVLNAVEDANENQKRILPQKINSHYPDGIKGKHFALWGLAFKPNTDDMREAPSRVLVSYLLDNGATVTAYDPVAMDEARHIYKGESRITFANSAMAAVENADALVIVTEWKEFKSPDFDTLKAKIRDQVIFDGRNLYEPQAIRQSGIAYFAIGRGSRPE